MTLNVTCSFFELNSSFIIPIYLENKSQTLGRLSSFYSRRLNLISHLFVKNKIVNRGQNFASIPLLPQLTNNEQKRNKCLAGNEPAMVISIRTGLIRKAELA